MSNGAQGPISPARTSPTEADRRTGSAPPYAASSHATPAPGSATDRAHPARFALGLAVLASERLRSGAQTSEALAIGVGLVQQSATEVLVLARRVIGRPGLATRTAAWASRRSRLALASEPVQRSRERVSRTLDEAKVRGIAIIAAGRADATTAIQTAINERIARAQAQAVAQIVDALVPHLTEQVIPRLIDESIPTLRAGLVIDGVGGAPSPGRPRSAG